MSNKIDISLDNISSLIDGLNKLNKDLDKISNDLCKEVVEDGSKYLEDLYDKREHDDNITDIHVKHKINGNEGEIIAYGNDVIYEEFGTGDKGEKDQHPAKNRFNLNDYNSGPFIIDVDDLRNGQNDIFLRTLSRNNIVSGKFWSYTKNGVPHLTQGVPSGKEMWRTRDHLLSNEYKQKLTKKGKEINDYIVTTIKR